jgi:pyruvate/2-oxoglutarate dehydrogenase complex dihydrolipoamide dehydrogenase (E3) component
MSDRNCDLLILGSGSTTFSAALCARELGKSAVMVGERTVGGTCVNRGCLPSKDLIEAARILHEARHPRFPGLVPRRMDVDFGSLVEFIDAAAMALRFRAGLDDFIDLVHVYPTLAEVLNIAAISKLKDPSKLSCCAE